MGAVRDQARSQGSLGSGWGGEVTLGVQGSLSTLHLRLPRRGSPVAGRVEGRPSSGPEGEARQFLVRRQPGGACASSALPLLLLPLSPPQVAPGMCLSVVTLCPRASGTPAPRGSPSPDDVLQGPQQWLLLVLDAVLGAQGLHQRGHLVEVVPGHGGEEAAKSVGRRV